MRRTSTPSKHRAQDAEGMKLLARNTGERVELPLNVVVGDFCNRSVREHRKKMLRKQTIGFMPGAWASLFVIRGNIEGEDGAESHARRFGL